MEKSEIQRKRHSLSHLLAAAVLDLYPNTKHTIGPDIENGFYYDFDFSSPISDKLARQSPDGSSRMAGGDLPKIEKKMKEILKTWNEFQVEEKTEIEAKEFFKNNEYKLELIDELVKEGSNITFYKSGNFVDLCGGGHVVSAKDISPDSFKLSHVAGAYWRGDEKNKMLTRIYGLAFDNKKELEAHIKMLEEAEKRDHRKLGKDLGLFVFSDLVGKGLPLWTDKGTTIRRELERFIVDEELRRGYKHVTTPDIAKLDLYEKSGHYPYYKDSMYKPIEVDDEKFMLRPMTCPHHFELYLSKPRSYKELPMRIGEVAKLYRYERSGELSGLMRVRSFCLADAHIICADSKQAGAEVNGALDLIEYVSDTLGLKKNKDYWYRLSLGDREDDKKYFKDDKAWEEAENVLREVLKNRNVDFVEANNEAAFYGPKIDVQMKNVSGKEETAFTVQYDFVMSKRFNLKYTDKDGKEKEALVIHRSSVGAIERSVAFLIEHYGGNFPLWLSPVQVMVLPISEDHFKYAEKVYDQIKESGIRVEIDKDSESLGKRIRNAKLQKIPYLIVVGEKEVSDKVVTLESREESLGQMSLEETIQKLSEEIKDKKINNPSDKGLF